MTNTTKNKKNNNVSIITFIVLAIIAISILSFVSIINAKKHYGFNYISKSDNTILYELGINPCNDTGINDIRVSPKLQSQGTIGFDYLCNDGKILNNCNIEIVNEKICLEYNKWNDCIKKEKNYEAYLNCNETRMVRIK